MLEFGFPLDSLIYIASSMLEFGFQLESLLCIYIVSRILEFGFPLDSLIYIYSFQYAGVWISAGLPGIYIASNMLEFGFSVEIRTPAYWKLIGLYYIYIISSSLRKICLAPHLLERNYC